jgi:hypothetical protein
MQYVDPLRSYQFDQELQWVYNPGDSRLNYTVFDSYAQPLRTLSVSVMPVRPESGAFVGNLPAYGHPKLLFEPSQNSVSRMLDDGGRLRAFRTIKRGLCITVCEISSDPAGGPGLSDQLARIKSSIAAMEAEPANYPFGSRLASEARLFQQIRNTVLRRGQVPETKRVLALTRKMSRLAASRKSAWWASQAETFARLQNNYLRDYLWNPALDVRMTEFPLGGQLERTAHRVIARLAKQAGLDLPGQPSAHWAAFAVAEIAQDSVPGGPSCDEPELKAPLLELALSQYLVAARRNPGLLSLLFAADQAERPPPGFGLEEQFLTARIAVLASRLADARDALGQHGDCVAADRLSIAALRLLGAHDPGLTIEDWPVEGLLADRLGVAAEHLTEAEGQ